jgi:hypothetical protein
VQQPRGNNEKGDEALRQKFLKAATDSPNANSNFPRRKSALVGTQQ